jgi:hypothetical protein
MELGRKMVSGGRRPGVLLSLTAQSDSSAMAENPCAHPMTGSLLLKALDLYDQRICLILTKSSMSKQLRGHASNQNHKS